MQTIKNQKPDINVPGMKVTLSVIVPVYNAAKTLKRCVESILEQSFHDFELILVNDGSNDGTRELCEELKKTFGKVRLINKERSGVSDSRNQGLDAARGTYLMFADADDWLAPDAFSLMVQAAEESYADLVTADFYRVVGQNVARKGKRTGRSVLTREEYADKMLKNPADFYYGVLWNKLYRRELVEEAGLRMPADISWCEDFIFNLEYLLRVKTVFPLHVPVYYYVKTEDSLVSQSKRLSNVVQMKRTVLRYYIDFYRQLYDEETYQRKRMEIYGFLLDAAGDGTVNPILPGTVKLGKERIGVPKGMKLLDNPLSRFYYERKRQERALETTAFRFDLEPEEVLILTAVLTIENGADRRTVKEVTGLSLNRVRLGVQKLSARGLLSRGKGNRLFAASGGEEILKSFFSTMEQP